ncbi:hypothetical protein SAMN05444320_104480 [Streptoalloteichus hindustanus]|uniref:Uncharacterized protein n=1 Tax=Streptoalloteichus hindustanus TaxID=2017 RepID=A0A1M5DJD4_STRHI|nr:hypothetical protein SAMN05444320_104480 [Streptoalloteichus hindustanus]
MTPEQWLRDYAFLALRVNRRMTENPGGTVSGSGPTPR